MELHSAASDDALSDGGPSNLTSDYFSEDQAPNTVTKAPPPLPTLFESKPQSTSGYVSTDQFDPFVLESPDSDSLPTPKLTTQDAASDSGYFPMPSMLDVQPAQQKQNGSQVPSSSNSVGNKTEGELVSSSGYLEAPPDLSRSAHSPSPTPSPSSSSSKNTLASTSAAVAKKSRQLFAKVLPKKSSSSSSNSSKSSKTKSDTSVAQQPSKQLPQQPLAPPPSFATNEVFEENDDSDMGDLVDLLDLGDPEMSGTSYSSVANGNQSTLTTSSDFDVSNSSGYFQDSSIGMGVVNPAPTSSASSTLTSDPFLTPQSSTVSTTNSGYFQQPEGIDGGGGGDFADFSTMATPSFQSYSEDDDLFLPDLPGDSEMNSTGGGVTYGGSIVTLSGGQFTSANNKN